MSVSCFDIIIIGCGPAGASAALALQHSGLSVALIDKALFPRDKICGDAQSADVLSQLELINPHLKEDFLNQGEISPCKGVKIVSPDGHSTVLPYYYKGKPVSGFIQKRKDFDFFLYQQLKKNANVKIFENSPFEWFKKENNKVQVKAGNNLIEGKILLAADGVNSAVKRFLNLNPIDRKFHSAGLRVYYANVGGVELGGPIEMYFLKSLLPGYLWIFPLAGNQANVGIGTLSEVVSKKGLNLRHVLKKELAENPLLKERFKNATPMETPKGLGLLLGSKQRVISGNGYLLLGDAAGLIDPISGEGVGNAIRSGRVAAEFIIKNKNASDFTEKLCAGYDKEIYRRMMPEFKASRLMQTICSSERVFNWMVKKAGADTYIHSKLTEALSKSSVKGILSNPKFYWKLLVA